VAPPNETRKLSERLAERVYIDALAGMDEFVDGIEGLEVRIEALEKIAADKVALNEHCAALETRIEALERLRQLVENDKGHIFCACGRCEETLKQLAALRSEEEK